MRSLTRQRPRRCGTFGRSLAFWFSQRPVSTVQRYWCRPFAALICASASACLITSAALAQRSAVTVDLGVLDTLGPADPTTNPGARIRLHMPEHSAQRPTMAPAGKSASVQPTPAPVAPNHAAPNQAAPNQATPNQATPNEAAPAPPSVQRPSAAIPAPTAPPPEAPAQTAVARPPAAGAPPVNTAPAERILFQPDETSLADAARRELDRLASRLSADSRLYVQLVAYAGAGGGDASQARRLSLTRALAARSYLVDHGVEIRQIDVRPLGNKFEPGGEADRIDLVVAQR